MFRKILVYMGICGLGAVGARTSEGQTGVATEVYQKASPSVFVISVRDEKGTLVSLGTGFLVAAKSLATNLHVVEGAHVFIEQGPLRIPAMVDKRDPVNDLAIVKVGIDISATPLQLSRKKLVPGESVFVIGNPEGFDKSISTGVVAGKREIEGQQLIQITAPISHGSSGGPVLNSDGQVVAVTVAMIEGGQNLNFAVPAEKLADLLAGKASEMVDFAGILENIDNLAAAHSKTQYSQDPNSEYQTTWAELDSAFKSAVTVAERDPKALLDIAERASTVGDFDAEIDAAQRATNISPSVRSNVLVGESLTLKARFTDNADRDGLRSRAEKAFRAALRLSKTPTAELYYDLADLLEDRDSTEDAALYFRRALELSRAANEPQVSADSIRGLVRTAYALHKPNESASWFTELTKMGATNVWDWQTQGDRLNEQKEYGEAGDAYRSAAALGGGWTNWCRAAVNFWDVRDDDALSSARECIAGGTGKQDSDKSVATAHEVVADVLNRRGVYSEALSHAREAADLDSSNAWYFEAEADALYGLRRFQEAINASNQAIRLSDGKYAQMHFRLGNSYFELENWEFARQSFEKAAELEPTDTASPYNVALCLVNLGYRSDAVRWFREVLRRNPNYPDRADIERRIAVLTGGGN